MHAPGPEALVALPWSISSRAFVSCQQSFSLHHADRSPSTCYNPKTLVKVVVRLAQDEKTYDLPRGLLEWHTSYFAVAFDPVKSASFMTSTDGELVLEEDIPVFDAFCCWLYTGRLKDASPTTTAPILSKLYLPEMTLYQTWVFADMRGIPALKNAAIDMLHERSCASWRMSDKNIIYCYKNTVRGSKLRKYIVGLSTQMQSYGDFQKLMATLDLPTDFLVDAIPILMAQGEGHKSIGREAWIAIDRCQWHDHSGPGGKLCLEFRT